MKILQTYKGSGIWWFRIFGYGIGCKNIKKHPLLSSEKDGYYKYIKIGNLVFRFLSVITLVFLLASCGNVM